MYPSRDQRKPLMISLLVGVLAVATAVIGLPAIASASSVLGSNSTNPVGSGGASTITKVGVAASCGTPKKGFAACFALRRTDIRPVSGLQPLDTTPSGYGPADLQSAYSLPANGGAGQTVAIVDAFDDPTAEADLAIYRQQFGLPPCTTANGCFRKVDQRGGTSYPPPDAGWAGEISLDVDMVSAAAPAAHILLVEADNNSNVNLSLSVDEAVALGAKYVSNSYGTAYSSIPGSGEDASEVTEFDPHYNHPGVAVVASSGDSDFGVSYPAASQYVTSVGGTSLVTAANSRGWSETVWHNAFGGPGSGCSLFEAKPAFQTDSGCSMRTVADVSAVADPLTGVAVYQTFGNSGWTVYGGTSVSSPIIASVFAAAGTPVTGTYPNSYPYANAGALNDVTSGLNGTCSPAYLCTAGTGYDGPTGLGTPNGLAAFTTGPHGELLGTVSDAATSAAIAGATVVAGDSTALTDAQGHYSMSVPVGTYDLTASAYGYASATVTGVSVTDGAHVTQNFALNAVPAASVSGTVTDGSGHNWPLYARIVVDGVPGGPAFTDPFTGHYSLNLPQGATYHLHVTPIYGGYQTVDVTVDLGTTNTVANVAVPVDAQGCTAPGYAVHLTGTTEAFDATTAPPGWVVDNGTGNGGWVFTDDGHRGNLTGGTGGFAIADSDHLGPGNSQNTTLTAPAVDFTGLGNPAIGFDTDYRGFPNQVGAVELSIDGGATFSVVWQKTTDQFRGPAHVDLPIPQATGHSALVRFRFISSFGWWWELDNVFIGAKACQPVPGGLVLGLVTDQNTSAPVNNALITSVDAPSTTASSAATPDDPNLADGFYWLFSALTGNHPFTAAKTHYTTATKTVNVAADFATRADFSLKAGQVTVTPASISKTLAWAKTATATLTLKNTGTATATVKLAERPGGFVLLTAGGAPLREVKGKFSAHSLHAGNGALIPMNATAPPDATPADAPWTSIANYPTPIQDNAVGLNDGLLYSAYGFDGTGDSRALFVYNPDSGSWSQLASATDTREKPAAAFIGGKFYTVGGWGASGDPDPKMEIYDPGTNTWSTGTATPMPFAGSGTAVLNGKLYVIGGCSAFSCGATNVEVFDPATSTWSAAAAYPEAVSWESCGALGSAIYCAGGTTDTATITHTYMYDPATDAWSVRANLPIDMWGSAYTPANGVLLVSGGVTNNSATITNRGFAYDPATDSWTALPNSNQTAYRSGSACGFYQIGGSPGGFSTPLVNSQVLPGFADCDNNADVPWLSLSATSATLAAGATAKITVTLDASVTAVTQPGTYTASIVPSSDTPYTLSPVAVSMTVNPPKTWGKIMGTVTSAVDGSPIAGATVQIDSWAASYTLKTDKFGQYALWLDVRNNPLQLIVAKDGWQPQTRKVKISKGTVTIANFVLKKAP